MGSDIHYHIPHFIILGIEKQDYGIYLEKLSFQDITSLCRRCQ